MQLFAIVIHSIGVFSLLDRSEPTQSGSRSCGNHYFDGGCLMESKLFILFKNKFQTFFKVNELK